MKTYETIVRGKWIYDGCKTIQEMAERLEDQREFLLSLEANGVEVREEIDDDYAFLEITTDDEGLIKDLTEKLGFRRVWGRRRRGNK